MSLVTLERLATEVKKFGEINYTYKTVRSSHLIVKNVPHALYPNGIGPDGEKEYLTAPVLYKLADIFSSMRELGLHEVDYKDMDSIK